MWLTQCYLDGLDVTLFCEPKLVPTEQEPCGFDDNGLDNTPDPDL